MKNVVEDYQPKIIEYAIQSIKKKLGMSYQEIASALR